MRAKFESGIPARSCENTYKRQIRNIYLSCLYYTVCLQDHQHFYIILYWSLYVFPPLHLQYIFSRDVWPVYASQVETWFFVLQEFEAIVVSYTYMHISHSKRHIIIIIPIPWDIIISFHFFLNSLMNNLYLYIQAWNVEIYFTSALQTYLVIKSQLVASNWLISQLNSHFANSMMLEKGERGTQSSIPSHFGQTHRFLRWWRSVSKIYTYMCHLA